MAASSSNSFIKHDENRICKDCCSTLIKNSEKILIKFWNEMAQFIEFKMLSLGYSDAISHSKKNMLDEPSSSDYYTSDEENALNQIKLKKTILLLNYDNIKNDYTSKKKGNVFFIIDNIKYIDIELILKMIKSLDDQYFLHEQEFKRSLHCGSDPKIIPRMIIEDIIIYNEKSYVNNIQVDPIAIQIKAKIYSHAKRKKMNLQSLIKNNLSMINSEMKSFSNHECHYTEKEVSKKINQLEKIIELLFTYDLGDGSELLKYETKIIRSSNGLKLNHQNQDYPVTEKISHIIKKCDIVIVVSNYNNIYLNDLITKYKKLKNTHQSWIITYMGIENDKLSKYNTLKDLIIGFNFVDLEKISFTLQNNDLSSSQTPSFKKRSEMTSSSSSSMMHTEMNNKKLKI